MWIILDSAKTRLSSSLLSMVKVNFNVDSVSPMETVVTQSLHPGNLGYPTLRSLVNYSD